MTLEKAIEVKCRTGEEFLNTDPGDIDEADRLSIEALKAIQRHQRGGRVTQIFSLPGETEK